MRIAIDMQPCQTHNSANRGIGRYAVALVKQLLNSDLDISLNINSLYSDKTVFKQFKNAKIFEFGYPNYVDNNITKQSRNINIAEELILHHYLQLYPDVLLFLNIFEGFNEAAIIPNNLDILHQSGIVIAAVVYDLIPLIMKEKYFFKNRDYEQWYMKKLLTIRQCDIILTISEATRQDVINYLNIDEKCVINISGAADSKFIKQKEKNKEYLCTKFNLKHNYILYTGGIDYRKNIEGLIIAFSKLSDKIIDKYSLAIVCSIMEKDKRRLFDLILNNGMSLDDIHFLGYVSDNDLVSLYNNCDLFVFPSLYEGLGLPVLEAMQCGAPVIGANNSSIAEIINNDAALFDATDIDSIRLKLERTLLSDEFRLELQQLSEARCKKFSWKLTGQKAIKALKECKPKINVDVGNGQLPSICNKIAYVSPIPPQKSGIANYSDKLLSYLIKYFDIDVYTNATIVECTYLGISLKVYPYNKLLDNSDKYDTIIYHFGNSEYHTYMYDLLLKCPGIVVLHDFYLSGMMYYLSTHDSTKHTVFEENLLYSHGTKGLSILKSKGLGYSILNYPLNKKIIDSASAIIIHSPYILQMIKNTYPNGVTTPVFSIKHLKEIVPEIRNIEKVRLKEKLGFSKGDVLITSFGFITEFKLIHILINASEILCHGKYKVPNIKIILAGDLIEDAYSVHLKELVKKYKLEDVIIFTGYLSDKLYRQYLIITDVAVQLRSNTRGETSGAVLDCLSYGIPVILNSYATFNDYPDNVVIKISEQPDVDELGNVLFKLISNAKLRAIYSIEGKKYLKKYHVPEVIVKEYVDVINKTVEKNRYLHNTIFTKNIAKICNRYLYSQHEVLNIVKWYFKNKPIRQMNRILFLFTDTSILSEILCNKFLETQNKYDFIPVTICNNEIYGYEYSFDFSEKRIYLSKAINKINLDKDIFVVSAEKINSDIAKKIKKSGSVVCSIIYNIDFFTEPIINISDIIFIKSDIFSQIIKSSIYKQYKDKIYTVNFNKEILTNIIHCISSY